MLVFLESVLKGMNSAHRKEAQSSLFPFLPPAREVTRLVQADVLRGASVTKEQTPHYR